MVGLLGVLCKARNDLRARGLGDSREETCPWCPSLRHPVVIPGLLVQIPFSGFSLTAGQHPASHGALCSQPLPLRPVDASVQAPDPVFLPSSWLSCAPAFSFPPNWVPAAACYRVNFPTASSLIPFIQWLICAFILPLHTAFADFPGQWTFSQPGTEYSLCAECFIRVISHNALSSLMRRTLTLFYRGEAKFWSSSIICAGFYSY